MPNTYKIIQNFFSYKFSPELKEKVWKWLINPTGHHEKEAALMQLWNEMDCKTDESTAIAYRHFRESRMQKPHKSPIIHTMRKLARIAAIFLLPVLSILATYVYIESSEENIELVECFVPRGEHKQIKLPDGTIAYLNSGTLLIYPQKFTGSIRSVYLIGEGNFDVRKDKHPFVVKTKNLRVKALGTKFNVHAYAEDEKTITTLESGSVAIMKPNEEQIITLVPNEQLEYTNSTGEFNKKVINTSVYVGWTKGELNFVSLTLKDIFVTLERVYNIHIIVPPHLATSDVYTIKFKHKDDIKQVMNIVTKTIGNIDYKMEDENILLIYSH